MTEPDLPSAVITLMKGVVYRDTHERAWKYLLQLQPVSAITSRCSACR